MAKYLVNLYSWESPRLCRSDLDLAAGDKIIIESEIGNDLGTVAEAADENTKGDTKPVIRKATLRDIETFQKNEEKREEILKTTKTEIKRLMLEMKLVDAHVSLDGSSMIVVFTADERVDFRELVKNLAKIFHRSVKMHQIGSRDEARRLGGCGPCGKELCCLNFSGNLSSITTEMARIQQVANRGSERISGLCGRLMCCLAYEAKQYQEMMAGMPEMGSSVKTKEGKGEVLEINVVKQEIRVKLEDGKILNIKKEEVK